MANEQQWLASQLPITTPLTTLILEQSHHYSSSDRTEQIEIKQQVAKN